MTDLVVDASVALTWLFKDEAGPETDALLDRVVDIGAYAPAMWRLEIANVLVMSERRGRITRAEIAGLIRQLDNLPILLDHEFAGAALSEIAQLARTERLTAYDAAYLELALRRGATLATKDKDLAAAARRLGLTVLP